MLHLNHGIAVPDPDSVSFGITRQEPLEGLCMLNFEKGNTDDDFPHLADSLAEHHQVVMIGIPEEQQLDQGGSTAPPSAESLDDWL